jgi:hypothetical protein
MCQITVVWQRQAGSAASQAGMLEDRSRSGAGISVNKPIPVGAKVEIRGLRGINRRLTGVVRHCRRDDLRFAIGIEYDEADDVWDRRGDRKPILTSNDI